jgi:endonuclease/exonuclease/phosphatase family metal-dependent hydrolase
VPADDLRILHWNVHSWRDQSGNASLTAVAALIGQAAPHIVTLAEVDETWGSPDRVRELAARCGYSWLFVPAFEFGHDRPDGGFGNALLTTLPVLAVQHWHLLWPPRIYDRTEPSEQRSVMLAQVGWGAIPLWAGITHMPREDTQARAAALLRLSGLWRGLREPWLICGDFNTPASSWLGEDDAVAVSPQKLTYPAGAPAEPIDYCVASPGFLLDAEVLPTAASDHLPLLISARCTAD